ncbi:hypothetical protein HGM15179_002508 [Zosterops borbonicus]|uniref:Uncharacterized protein n=1 Tax=Zosterops borbonicus TaxID=364589 RepID=A0A8K1GSS0_9PASS|nr:hypothetical protein HGM15179_002508 [Zosterops borbonicus]
MAVRITISHSALKLCGICFSSWMPTDLWGLMVFIQEFSKSWLIAITKPLSRISNHSQESGKVPADRKMASVVPVFKKGKKEDPGNYKLLVSSVPAKAMKKIILGGIEKHLKDNAVIGYSHEKILI